jgi:hypothetical protein
VPQEDKLGHDGLPRSLPRALQLLQCSIASTLRFSGEDSSTFLGLTTRPTAADQQAVIQRWQERATRPIHPQTRGSGGLLGARSSLRDVRCGLWVLHQSDLDAYTLLRPADGHGVRTADALELHLGSGQWRWGRVTASIAPEKAGLAKEETSICTRPAWRPSLGCDGTACCHCCSGEHGTEEQLIATYTSLKAPDAVSRLRTVCHYRGSGQKVLRAWIKVDLGSHPFLIASCATLALDRMQISEHISSRSGSQTGGATPQCYAASQH